MSLRRGKYIAAVLIIVGCLQPRVWAEGGGLRVQESNRIVSEKQKLFPNPSQDTRSASMGALTEAGWPIGSVLMRGRIESITTEAVNRRFEEGDVRCPGSVLPIVRYRAKIDIGLDSISANETVVRILLHVEGWEEDFLMEGGRWIICESAGTAEEELYSRITDFLRAP